LFVILAGFLYGSVTPTGESYTEREYRTAVSAGKPRLVFLASDTLDVVTPPEPGERKSRQTHLREELARDRIVSLFSGAQDAAVRVVQAIHNWETSGDAGEASRLHVRVADSDVPPREFSEPFVGIGRGPDNAFRVHDPEVSWEHGQIV